MNILEKIKLEKLKKKTKLCSAKELIEHAKALQKVSIVGDESIEKMQSLLLTFKEIKGDNFKRATEAILDTAVAMAKARGTSVDLSSTTLQLGKALNDPVAILEL